MLSLRADAMTWSPLLKDELCICNLLGLARVAQQGAAEGIAWRTLTELQVGQVVLTTALTTVTLSPASRPHSLHSPSPTGLPNW